MSLKLDKNECPLSLYVMQAVILLSNIDTEWHGRVTSEWHMPGKFFEIGLFFHLVKFWCYISRFDILGEYLRS